MSKMNGLIPMFATIAGFGVTFLMGIWMVPFLKKLKFGQTIYDEGPRWHKSKQGTPTMGGLMIIIGVICAIALSFTVASFTRGSSLIAQTKDPMKMTFFFSGIGMALGMGFIGFIDDYIKVVKKRNLGLTARQKTFFQLLVAVCYLSSLALGGMSTTWLPWIGEIDIMSGPGLLFWPIAVIFVYGFTNAVNLSDGIDGLATTVTLVIFCFFMLASGLMSFSAINVLSAAAAGACIGFLCWNAHPAKVFMGDTGSMFLGGLVVSLAFGINRPVLLFLAGIVYLIEALSVVIQVSYYKRIKKRIFKMSPLHHHFEMSGWSEEKIVLVFSLITLVGCFVSILPIIFHM